MFKSPKNNKQIPFESKLERDFCYILEFDEAVVAFDSQPLQVEYIANSGRKTRGFPDFLVRYQNASTMRTELCDVKFRDDLRSRWPELKTRLKAACSFARRQGWIYRIKSEVEIRTPFLDNAKRLLPYLRHPRDLDTEALLVRVLGELHTSTPAELLAACCAVGTDRSAALPILWALIARRSVRTNLNEMVTPHSRIWTD